MPNLPLIIYMAFLAIVSFGLILLEAVKKLESRKSRVRGEAEAFNPRVLVMVPCRGSDISLLENLLSLKNQDFSNYDMVAIVDSEDDVSLGAIREAGVRHIVSDAECIRCSGKVKALASALSAFSDYDAYVIADSDATFSRKWLSALIAPLASPEYGLSTAFPLFVPMEGFWSRVKMVWGFVGNGMMESSITRFGWGGSLAFRKSLLDNGNFSLFREAVSDDSALTRFSLSAGLRIAYCDGNYVSVKSKETLSSFVEWSNRQTALAIRGSEKLYSMGLLYFSLRLLLLASSIALAVTVTPYALLLLLPYALNIAKIYVRSGRRDPLIAPLFMAMDMLYIGNLLKARRMATIVWRGREYVLPSDGQ